MAQVGAGSKIGDDRIAGMADVNAVNGALEAHKNARNEHLSYLGSTAGAANAYTAQTTDIGSDYPDGLGVVVKIHAANTGPATLQLNALPAKSIKRANGRDVTAGALAVNGVYTLRYNGTDFILQGEGGSGNATPAQVLSGRTFTNDEGEQTGAMPDRGMINTYSSTSDSNFSSGYYTEITIKGDNNLVPFNIKKGVRILGVTGELAPRFYGLVKKTITIGYNETRLTVPITAFNFVPQEFTVGLGLHFSSNHMLTGHMVKLAPGSPYYAFQDELRLDSGALSGQKELYCWVQATPSYISGTNLYLILEFVDSTGFKGRYPVSAQTIEIGVSVWG